MTDRSAPDDHRATQDRSDAVARLVAGFAEGRLGALARAISVVEDQSDGFESLLHAVLDGRAHEACPRVGFTGPPGAGKSTLVGALAGLCRERNERLGIVAVDPSSPYSGGALLGDRIRMHGLAEDPGVYIRSMASRGSVGGLAATTREVLDLMAAFGFDRLLVETVGVGQTELEIARAADVVVVVLVPESGDAVQAMKAGLMEIADVFVVNKADRPEAAAFADAVREALSTRTAGARDVPVLETCATSGEGVAELLATVAEVYSALETSGELHARRRARTASRVRDVLERGVRRALQASKPVEDALRVGVDRIEAGEATPYSVVRDVLGDVLR